MNYHGRVMNIPAEDKYAGVLAMKAVRVSYQEGHRDARHAAAEIANEADARVSELEAENAALKAQVEEAEGRARGFQQTYENALTGNRILLERETAANARADAAEKTLAELREKWPQVEAAAKQAISDAESAEAEAGRLREALNNLVDAVARARKSDDAVARNAGITADWDEHEDAHASLIIFENAARALLAAALQDGTDTSAAKLRENCIAYPTKLPERPTCVWLSDGRKIGIQREGGAVWLRIENAATVIPATPDAAGIDAHDAKGGDAK